MSNPSVSVAAEQPDVTINIKVSGDLPEGGSDGQVLTKQNGKNVWADPPAGGGNFDYIETDPTVPAWAKQPEKPEYTPAEVGADPSGSAAAAQSAAQKYADDAIAKIPAPDVSSQIATHNVSTVAHGDIRTLIAALTERLNTIANSDDVTLDQLGEIVAYIKTNKSLIDAVTTNKVSVVDIVDDLTTNVSNKPLSAAQGVVLKMLIDAITVPTELSELNDDASHRLVTDTEKAAWDAKSNFSGKYADLTGKPTIPTVPTNVSAFENDKGYLTEHQDISGKLDASKLPEAINTALAQAKASGEFNGKDGISPTVAVSTITGGHRITITDKNGTKTVDVMDGEKGDSGRGIAAIARTSGSGAAGTTDTYTITYTDGTTSIFSVYNGKNGTNGTSVTVKSVSESTADGGSNIVTFSDGETLTVKNGSKGDPGKTPVKGTDYFTAADKAEMVNAVIAALPVYNGEVV